MGLGQVVSCLVCLVIVALAIAIPLYYLADEETKAQIKNTTGVSIPDFPNLPESLRDRLPEIRIWDQEDPFNMVSWAGAATRSNALVCCRLCSTVYVQRFQPQQSLPGEFHPFWDVSYALTTSHFVFSQLDPEDANRWMNDGSGLDLELVNALDSQWHSFFEISADEWDRGSPDALTLSKSSDTPDSECKAINGLQKVCNGDYGETDWKGINKVLLENGWIVASMARMNDFFFVQGGDDAKRQYTMCHELGKVQCG